MKLSQRTSQILAKLTILSLLLPFSSTVTLAGNPAVGVPNSDQANKLNQQQQDGDRSSSSGAAQAMAAMGAAMAGLGCVMGMKAAQEEPDPSKKQMMMAMAMQQCAQAGQNAASAAQNGDQKKKLDEQAPQMNSNFEVPEMKVAEDGKTTDLSKLAEDSKSSSSDSSSKEPTKETTVEKPTGPESTKTASPQTTNSNIPDMKPAKSVPGLIEVDTITAKKDNKEENGNSNNEATKALGSALAGKGSADDLLKKALAESGTNPNDTAMIRPSRGASVRKDGSDFEGGSGSGGGGSSEGGGGSSPFDNLLAQMMGGGQPGPGAMMNFMGDSDIINIGKNKSGQPKLNIFQFASTVYSELNRSQNRIANRRQNQVSPVSRVLSSEPNLVTQGAAR